MSDLRLHQSIRVDELVENGKLVIFYNFDRTYDLYFLLFHISVCYRSVKLQCVLCGGINSPVDGNNSGFTTFFLFRFGHVHHQKCVDACHSINMKCYLCEHPIEYDDCVEKFVVESRAVLKPVPDAAPMHNPASGASLALNLVSDVPQPISNVDQPAIQPKTTILKRPLERPTDLPMQQPTLERPMQPPPLERPMQPPTLERPMQPPPLERPMQPPSLERPMQPPTLERPMQPPPLERPTDDLPMQPPPLERPTDDLPMQPPPLEQFQQKSERCGHFHISNMPPDPADEVTQFIMPVYFSPWNGDQFRISDISNGLQKQNHTFLLFRQNRQVKSTSVALKKRRCVAARSNGKPMQCLLSPMFSGSQCTRCVLRIFDKCSKHQHRGHVSTPRNCWCEKVHCVCNRVVTSDPSSISRKPGQLDATYFLFMPGDNLPSSVESQPKKRLLENVYYDIY